MDLGTIFDTYTDSASTNERTTVLDESAPLTIEDSSAINYFLTKLNNDDVEDLLDQNEEINDPELSEITPDDHELELGEDLLDALSDLDNTTDTEEEPTDTSENEIPKDTNDELEEELIDNNEGDILEDIDTAEFADDSDLELGEFMDNLNETDASLTSEDFDNVIFDETHPEEDFEIEHPEDLFTQNNQIEEIEEQELPDFSDVELEDTEDLSTPEEFLDPQNLSPTDYESIDDLKSFDVWNHSDTDEDFSHLQLNEEQIFLIREKINSLNNKDLRFELRNIILEPDLHQEYFDELISLLIINSTEQTLIDFLDKHLPKIDNEWVASTLNNTESRSIFFAEDVIALEQMKENFAQTFQRLSLYTLIIILLGTVLWTGIAQPFRVNSLFKKGVIALQNDHYTEGESLFNQATQIAGRPILKWFVKYGDIYANKSLINLAEQKYKSALAIAPKDIKTGLHIGDFYTNLGIKYYPKAIKIMSFLSSQHPKEFQVWDYFGSLYIECAEAITNDRPKQTDLYYQAADIYKEFILNNINNSAPYYKMIEIYIKIGNAEQINKIAHLITQLDSKFLNVKVLTELAAYYTDRRKLIDSERIFRRLMPFLDNYINRIPQLQKLLFKEYNINPLSISNILSESFYEIARYKMLSSDPKGAGLLLTNSLIFDSQNYKGYNLLGEVYLSSHGIPNRLNKANSLFQQSLKINPDNYKPYKNIGHIYYYWDQELPNPEDSYSTALYNYRMAKALIPKNKKDYLLSYNLGWLEYHDNQAQKALDLWSDIYKDNPNNPALSYALGVALFKTDSPRLAQIELTKVANTFQTMKNIIIIPNPNNKRHREIFTQLARTCNNIGVINANYGLANPTRRNDFESQALINFYNAKDISDQLNTIYSIAEYNIGVLTRPNIRNRQTAFDNLIPKQTTLDNLHSEFQSLLLEDI